MTDAKSIEPAGPVRGRIRPPGSKSITNRALACAAVADGPSTLDGVLDSQDTRVMLQSLQQLGIELDVGASRKTATVAGCGGTFPQRRADIFVANSGTTMRFLAAMLTIGAGEYRLAGVPRMQQRPIGDLLDAMVQLGAEVECTDVAGFPPIVVRANGLQGGTAHIKGNISSQFLSGLLMAAPYARTPVTLVVDGPLVSQPYVVMTLRVMEQFGVTVRHDNLQVFHVPAPTTYCAARYQIEPDASAASYFWAAAAITGGAVTVDGLGTKSLQGDVAFCDCLQAMGCRVDRQPHAITVAGGQLHGVDVNMNGISDTVQTLAAVALFAEGPTIIRGVGHIRFKETDRIGDLARELRKLGAEVNELEDGLQIKPAAVRGCAIDTYDDHRMAMSLALVGLRTPGIVIRNPRCTDKTYPQFFDDLDRLRTGGEDLSHGGAEDMGPGSG